ncbi:MAG: helix-turn-helix domain-containing protein, partial [Clostridia bacterium]
MRKIFFKECLKRMNSVASEEHGSYTHLTNEERIIIEVLYTAGFKQNFIAIFLGRSRSTIGRELGKNV